MASRGAKRNGRGGYQAPAAPAPVSGPGALSARTDGRPQAQPIRPQANAGGYGDRQAAVAQQQSAPMRAGGVSAPPGTAPQDPAAAGGIPTGIDPFGPSNRPWEPVTAGATLGPGAGAPPQGEDARALVSAMLQQWGDDELRDLLEEMDQR